MKYIYILYIYMAIDGLQNILPQLLYSIKQNILTVNILVLFIHFNYSYF